VAGCCGPRGCEEFFGDAFARRVAKRYRKRGLDKTSRRMVAFLERAGLDGASVLEIGGGVGEIQLELLKRGASNAVSVELSPAYEGEARGLLREAGIDETRVERRQHDIAADPDGVEPADVVVLHRVVCCYPDYERLLGAAASHAKQALVFSHPPRNLASRAFLALQNLGLRLVRKEFRAFAHPPAAMLDVCRDHGLSATFAHSGVVWQVEGLERSLRSRPPRRSP
jgi:2-polyprenyl-3-methyl-5-hydroxy-6-metoxy-1,4-benzoquinol methylase